MTKLNLLLHALIFVVESVIGAMSRIVREKIAHVVLVQGNEANVCVVFLVVIVKFTALAIRGLLFVVCCHALASLSATIIT